MRIIVTGAAGFIGMHASRKLLELSAEVVGIDNLNDYYDPTLKRARLAVLARYPRFRFLETDIASPEVLSQLLQAGGFDGVLHLAAQAGVRYSLKNPAAYVQSNLLGFSNVLDALRGSPSVRLVYASSSSVYGNSSAVPFSEDARVASPVSFYAATKLANEVMAASYSHLYGIRATGLRYFTVYGPWGRPDMSPWLFSEAMLDGRTIDVFNHGKMRRDFTYVDDIVAGTLSVLANSAESVPGSRHDVLNIGGDSPVELESFIGLLEESLGVLAAKRYLPMQPGDVLETWADVSKLNRYVGFKPSVSLKDGLRSWSDWFKSWRREA